MLHPIYKMNWVGGARKRICGSNVKKGKNQRKLQKDYFEKRRLGIINLNALGKSQRTNLPSKDNSSKISQDLLEFQDYIQHNAGELSDPVQQKYVSVEMPLSPVGPPSTLFLSHSPSSTIDLFGTTMKKPQKAKILEEMPPPVYGVSSAKAQRKARCYQSHENFQGKTLKLSTESHFPSNSTTSVGYFVPKEKPHYTSELHQSDPLDNFNPKTDIGGFDDFQIVPSQSNFSVNSGLISSGFTEKANEADESEIETSSSLFKIMSPLQESDISLFEQIKRDNAKLDKKSSRNMIIEQEDGICGNDSSGIFKNKKFSLDHPIPSGSSETYFFPKQIRKHNEFNVDRNKRNFPGYCGDASDWDNVSDATSDFSRSQNQHLKILNGDVIRELEHFSTRRVSQVHNYDRPLEIVNCANDQHYGGTWGNYKQDTICSADQEKPREEANLFCTKQFSTEWNEYRSNSSQATNLLSNHIARGEHDLSASRKPTTTTFDSTKSQLTRSQAVCGMSKSVPHAFAPRIEPIMTSTPSYEPIYLNKETLDVDVTNHISRPGNTITQKDKGYPIHDLLSEMIDLESQSAAKDLNHQGENVCQRNGLIHKPDVVKEVVMEMVSRIEQGDMNSRRTRLDSKNSSQTQAENTAEETVKINGETLSSLKGNDFESQAFTTGLKVGKERNELVHNANLNRDSKIIEERRKECSRETQSDVGVVERAVENVPLLDTNLSDLALQGVSKNKKTLSDRSDKNSKGIHSPHCEHKESCSNFPNIGSETGRLAETLNTQLQQNFSQEKQITDTMPVVSSRENKFSTSNTIHWACEERDPQICHGDCKKVTISTQTVKREFADAACSPIVICPTKEFEQDYKAGKRNPLSRVYSLRSQPRAFWKGHEKKEE